jgi:hypothetical protein
MALSMGLALGLLRETSAANVRECYVVVLVGVDEMVLGGEVRNQSRHVVTFDHGDG